MRTRTFVAVGLVVALLLAGIGSYYASSHPDGLEYVAEQAGFADTAREASTADGPLADYQVRGIENDRLSGGIAGVAGALVVLLLAGGLTLVVRRRGARDADDADSDDADSDDVVDPEQAAADESAEPLERRP